MYLSEINPTPEQRRLFFLPPNVPVLLSGRAGSGKTTTSILRAAQLVKFYERQGFSRPRVGFFVFNNSLRTYLDTLASLRFQPDQYDVLTIDKWCRDFLRQWSLLDEDIAEAPECIECLRTAIRAIGLAARQPRLISLGEEYLIDEVQYLLGRFGLDTARYIRSERVGRGMNPVLSEDMKRAIAEELVPNYQFALESNRKIEWNLIRSRALDYVRAGIDYERYDIVVIDEAQDLCALQVQIGLQLVSPETRAITFVRDATQRIYTADYRWGDVGVEFEEGSRLDLKKNYRNTREIALVAASLMNNAVEDDSELDVLDPALTVRTGPKPLWVQAKYLTQLDWVRRRLQQFDLVCETTAILHIQHNALSQLHMYLQSQGIQCLKLKEEAQFSAATGTVYLSTLHSAKGLEFDHVIIVGYDEFFAPGRMTLAHRETSAHLAAHRKLLYTAISRARKTLMITSSVDNYSRFLGDIDPVMLEIVCVR